MMRDVTIQNLYDCDVLFPISNAIFFKKKILFQILKKRFPSFCSNFVCTLCDEGKQRRITVTCTTHNFFTTQTLHDTWVIRAQCCLRNNWCSMKNLSKHSFPKTWYKFSFCNSFFSIVRHHWNIASSLLRYISKKKKMTSTCLRSFPSTKYLLMKIFARL